MGRIYLLKITFFASWEETCLGIRGERVVYSSTTLSYVPFALCAMRNHYFFKIDFFLNYEYRGRLSILPMSLWSCVLESPDTLHFHHLPSLCGHHLGILWPSLEGACVLQLLGSVVPRPCWTDLKDEICAFSSSSSRRHWVLKIYICMFEGMYIRSGLARKSMTAVSFCLWSTECNLSMNWPWTVHRNFIVPYSFGEVPPDMTGQFCFPCHLES